MSVPDQTCPWGITWDDVLAACATAPDLDPDVAAAVVAAAEAAVWQATGRRYGLCERTVAPRAGAGCRYRWRRCSCCWRDHVDLDVTGRAPVEVVLDVIVAGAALDPLAYRVDDARWLVRTDGGRWPTCYDDGTDDAFVVHYVAGEPPPADLVLSAVLPLACELGKKAAGLACSVPDSVVSVSREGVQFVMTDLTRLVLAGLVGPAGVVAAIVRHHPHGPAVAEPGGIVSPEALLSAPAASAWTPPS